MKSQLARTSHKQNESSSSSIENKKKHLTKRLFTHPMEN
jgi:hypothetical protein